MKLWYIHTVEFYSATKKNKIMSFAGKWMGLENVMLSEISQPQKVKGHMFSVIFGSYRETGKQRDYQIREERDQ